MIKKHNFLRWASYAFNGLQVYLMKSNKHNSWNVCYISCFFFAIKRLLFELQKKEAKYIVSKPWKIFFKIKNKRLINGLGTILSDSLNNFVVRTNSSNKNVCLFILRHFIWLCFLIQVNCTKALRNLSKAYLWIVYQYWLLNAT